MDFSKVKALFDDLKAEGKDDEAILSTIEENMTEYYATLPGQDEILHSPNPGLTVNEVVDIILQQVARWLK